MMVMGLLVALAVGGDRATPSWLRTLAAAAAVPMCFTFFFTFSRGGWLALGARARPLLRLHDHAAGRDRDAWRPSWPPWGWCCGGCAASAPSSPPTTDDALRTLQGHTLLRWALAALARHRGRAAARRRSCSGPCAGRAGPTVAAGAVVLAAVCLVVFGGSGVYLQRHGGTQWVKDKAHALVTDAESERQRQRDRAGCSP